MPHVVVKMYPGRTEEQKKLLADRIVLAVTETTRCPDYSVSVALEEVPENQWAESVYRPEILEKEETLIRKPGYNPFKG